MRFIGQLHASELCLNLCAGELLKFLLGFRTRSKRNRREQPDHCCTHLFLRCLHISTAFLLTTNAAPRGPGFSPFPPRSASARQIGDPDVASMITDRSKPQLFALAVLSSAERSPLASLTASSFAQKWRKNSRGCSLSMW